MMGSYRASGSAGNGRNSSATDDDDDDDRLVLPLHSAGFGGGGAGAGGGGGLMSPMMMSVSSSSNGGGGGGSAGNHQAWYQSSPSSAHPLSSSQQAYYSSSSSSSSHPGHQQQPPYQPQQHQQHLQQPYQHQQRHSMHALPSSSSSASGSSTNAASFTSDHASAAQQQQQQHLHHHHQLQYGMMLPPPPPPQQHQQGYASSSSTSTLNAGGPPVATAAAAASNPSSTASASVSSGSSSLVDSLARSASLGGRRKEPAKHDIERGFGLGYGVAYGDPALAYAGNGGSGGGGGGGAGEDVDDIEYGSTSAATGATGGGGRGGGRGRGRDRGWSQDLGTAPPPVPANESFVTAAAAPNYATIGGYGDPPPVLQGQSYASHHQRRPSGASASVPRMSFSSSSSNVTGPGGSSSAMYGGGSQATMTARNPYASASSGGSQNMPAHQGISPTASRMSVNSSSTSPSWLPPPPSSSSSASASASASLNRPLRESSSFDNTASSSTPHSVRLPPLSSPREATGGGDGRMASTAASPNRSTGAGSVGGGAGYGGLYSPAQATTRMYSQPSSTSPATTTTTSSKISPMDYSPNAGSQNLPLLPPQLAARGGPPQALRSRSSQQLEFASYRTSADVAARAGGPSASSSALPFGGQENVDPATMMSISAHGGGRESAMIEDKRRRPKLRPVRDPAKDLLPVLDAAGYGRRADPEAPGQFLSPLKCLTSHLAQTYSICNPAFQYEVTHNPRRVLTKPSKPCHNGGSDNEDYDYILYVNDVLTSDNGTGDKYLILDVLGQGTFGQVVKCQNTRTHEIVAVKVVKNKPAYFNQSMMEVAILQLLNTEHDKNDEHHLLRMLDSFIHHKHLCIVFECLASNLYELIKHNQFRGLSLQLVKMFTQQLLDALAVLKSARLIHCDLKPENILLKSLNSPQIKIIDFGSACHERQTVYTYIQSRFYRSPEVLLGLPYSTAIDMWSLGCIVVELFLGLPLFPGTSEYNQLSRIVDMLGAPPLHLLEVGKQVPEFFNVVGVDDTGRKRYRLKSMDQYAHEHGTNEQPSKQYFKASKLPDIIKTYAMPKKITRQADIDKEMHLRAAFIDFVQGLLDLDPIKRWSPQQAKLHPFITGEPFHGSWQPPLATSASSSRRSSQAPVPEVAQAASSTTKTSPSSRHYASASQGSRGSYGGDAPQQQELVAHGGVPAVQRQQAYPNTPFNNPFQPPSAHGSSGSVAAPPQIVIPPPPPTAAAVQQHVRMPSLGVTNSVMRSHASQPRIPSINSGGQVVPGPATASVARGDYQGYYGGDATGGAYSHAPQQQPPQQHYQPQDAYAGSNNSSQHRRPASYGISAGSGGGRNRANTINQMDVIPPALARLTHLGPQDPAGTRSALTPILNRDDAIREWERRQNAIQMGHHKRPSMAYPGNPQLEYLQEQAEMMGYGSEWAAHHHHQAQQQQQQQQAYGAAGAGNSRMGPPPPPPSSYHLSPSSSAYAATMQPPPPAVVDSYESHQRRRSGGGAHQHHRSALSGDFGMLDVSPSSAGGGGGGGSASTPVSPGRYGHSSVGTAATHQDPHAIGHHEYMRHHTHQQQAGASSYLPSSSMSSPAMPTSGTLAGNHHGGGGSSSSYSDPPSSSSYGVSQHGGGYNAVNTAAAANVPPLPPPAVAAMHHHHQQYGQHGRAMSDASTIHAYGGGGAQRYEQQQQQQRGGEGGRGGGGGGITFPAPSA